VTDHDQVSEVPFSGWYQMEKAQEFTALSEFAARTLNPPKSGFQ